MSLLIQSHTGQHCRHEISDNKVNRVVFQTTSQSLPCMEVVWEHLGVCNGCGMGVFYYRFCNQASDRFCHCHQILLQLPDSAGATCQGSPEGNLARNGVRHTVSCDFCHFQSSRQYTVDVYSETSWRMGRFLLLVNPARPTLWKLMAFLHYITCTNIHKDAVAMALDGPLVNCI